jgi:hypothetical protein
MLFFLYLTALLFPAETEAAAAATCSSCFDFETTPSGTLTAGARFVNLPLVMLRGSLAMTRLADVDGFVCRAGGEGAA